MSTTTSPARGGYRIVATQVSKHNHADLVAIAFGGGAVRDERARPEPPVQMWVDETAVPGLDVAVARMVRDEQAAGGFYAADLRYPTLAAALEALPALVACNAAVRDGAKRLKVVPA